MPITPSKLAALYASLILVFSQIIAYGQPNILPPPSPMEGRAPFGAATYLEGDLIVGAAGDTITESDIIRDQSVKKFFVTTSASEVYIGFPLGTELTAGHEYNFELLTWDLPQNQYKFPKRILLNNQIIWEQPQPIVWDNNIAFSYTTKGTNDGIDDIIWIVVQIVNNAKSHLLHVRPVINVDYVRGSASSNYNANPDNNLPTNLHYPKAEFYSTVQADLPSTDNGGPSNIKSPVWPIIGAELHEHRLDPDAYDFLVGRGINMVYFQDDDYTGLSGAMATKFTNLTTENSITGLTPLKLIAAKYKTHRRPDKYRPVDQLNLMKDIIVQAPSGTATEFIMYCPEVPGAEMTRYLNNPQTPEKDGDWTNIINGSTKVFEEDGENFPSTHLFNYLPEWESELQTFNAAIRNQDTGIGNKKLGVVMNTQMAGFSGFNWMYRSLPVDTAGDSRSFIQNKTLLRQNVNITVANVRGHAKAYDRLMATRVDAWAGNRSTWYESQMERAYRVFYYGGTDLMDHESGEGITQDQSVFVPNGRGAPLFKVAKWIRTRKPRGTVDTPIAIMSGNGSIFGRVSIYDWENIDNYLNSALDRYAADQDLYNVFFAEFGDRYRTEIDRLFTGTPYGPVDIVPADAPDNNFYQNYELLAIFGLNQMKVSQANAMISYVDNGGTLVIAAGQLMNKNNAGSRKVTNGGNTLLSHFGAGILTDSSGFPIKLGTHITDLINYKLDAGSSGAPDEYWVNKSGVTTTNPKAVVYNGANGGKLVLLSGEVLINTGLTAKIDMADPASTYAGQLLADYAAEAANVLPDASSDRIEAIVLDDADEVTVALFNHGNFGDPDISPSGTFNGTVKLRRSLFPTGMNAGDLSPVYTYPNTNGNITVTANADFFTFNVQVDQWREMKIPKKNCNGNQTPTWNQNDFTVGAAQVNTFVDRNIRWQVSDDDPNTAWTFHKVSGPSWGSINPANGKITGTPTQAGDYTFAVWVSDGCNDSQIATVHIKING
ncbi:MAG: putative Ig domain-containing protein [Verrucomicrobiota bacterium]